MAAVSNIVTFVNPNEPLHGHLALTNNINEMVYVTMQYKICLNYTLCARDYTLILVASHSLLIFVQFDVGDS